jgi:hypothetical protein
MPVLGGEHVAEAGHGGVDGVEDLVAAGYREAATRAEVVLRIDDDQGVVVADFDAIVGHLIMVARSVHSDSSTWPVGGSRRDGIGRL